VALWKLDAIYAPLDAQDATARNERILERLRPAAILGGDAALERCHGEACRVHLAEIEARAASDSAPRWCERTPVQESQPAYVIFTSGSTGTPKGVVISHGSLLDYFYNHNQVLRFTSASRVLSFAPFHFDVSIEDTLLPLSVGAFVYQFRGIPVAPLVHALLTRESITHMIAVSTLLTLITQNPAEITQARLPALEMVMTGAEVCDPKIINIWKEQMPRTRVINAYGPTEVTIVCLTHTIERAEPARRSAYPIGTPLPGVRIRLVGEDGEILESGPVGELWVGGSQVMLEYLDQPEETAQVICEHAGVRYYRTGDLCRFDERGCVEFIGRADDEIKLAGRRINLGEIRQLALAHPQATGIATGVVALRGRRQIALVLVSEADARALRAVSLHLHRQLPEHMRPTVMALAHSPHLGANGKMDERHLLSLLSSACSRYEVDSYILSADGEFVPLAGTIAC
jgi:amino acid adenylation domain-containing protein